MVSAVVNGVTTVVVNQQDVTLLLQVNFSLITIRCDVHCGGEKLLRVIASDCLPYKKNENESASLSLIATHRYGDIEMVRHIFNYIFFLINRIKRL